MGDEATSSKNPGRTRSCTDDGTHIGPSASPLQITMGNNNDELIVLTRGHKCRVLCGFEIVLLFFLVAGIGAGHIYLYWHMADSADSGLWILLCLAILSCLLATSFLIRILKEVFCTTAMKEEETEELEGSALSILKRAQSLYFAITDVNGRFYLVKMYVSEVAEVVQQMINTLQIYSCMMPLGVSVLIPIGLAFGLGWNIRSTFHLDSQIKRDRQLLIDVITDLFCLVFPISYVWFAFNIPISVGRLVQITLVPTLSLLSKSSDIWEDIFKIDLQRIQKKLVLERKRSSSRKSIFRLDANAQILEEQFKYFPKSMRYAFIALNGTFAFLFIILVCFQLANQPSDEVCDRQYTEEVWSGGCAMKVPFCQKPFIANCDCAVVNLLNYSQKTLPDGFGKMSSLMHLGVYSGKLEALPNATGVNHRELVVLHVMGNHLKHVPDGIGALEKLISLYLSGNLLQQVPDSLTNLKALGTLYLSNNKLTSLPKDLEKLAQLVTLNVANNRLTVLPERLSGLKRLYELYIFQNGLTGLPKSIGDLRNLGALLAWNNAIKTIPDAIGNLGSLEMVDFRNNNLTALPSSISSLERILYFRAAGNPVCLTSDDFPNNLGTVCTQQCAVDCPSPWLGDRECDDGEYIYSFTKAFSSAIKQRSNEGCNTKTCDYDNGDCPVA